MEDLEFILGLGEDPLESGRKKPVIVEVGRVLVPGGPARRIFVSSNGRIGASMEGGTALISRHLGYIGDGKIALTLGELRSLDAACRDWAQRRDGWAAFWESCAGYPGGYGSGWYFQAPGKESPRVKVGSRCYGHVTGEQFRGKDVVIALERPLRGIGGARLVAVIRHEGETFGRPEGEEVGVVYQLGRTCRLEALRHEAVLEKDGRRMGLEPGDDESFIRGLLDVMEGNS